MRVKINSKVVDNEVLMFFNKFKGPLICTSSLNSLSRHLRDAGYTPKERLGGTRQLCKNL